MQVKNTHMHIHVHTHTPGLLQKPVTVGAVTLHSSWGWGVEGGRRWTLG